MRAVTAVKDLATFRRFLALVASRHGQMLNKTDLAAPLGVSVPTIAQWLGVLETTAQVLIVPPFYENLGKRLIKSPKVYLADSGLACHLLGIESAARTRRSRRSSARLFEGFIAAEIVKAQVNAGRRRELYYFRDEQGLEVDFVVPGRGGSLALVECKADAPSRRPWPRRCSGCVMRQGRASKGSRREHVPRSPSSEAERIEPCTGFGAACAAFLMTCAATDMSDRICFRCATICRSPPRDATAPPVRAPANI